MKPLCVCNSFNEVEINMDLCLSSHMKRNHHYFTDSTQHSHWAGGHFEQDHSSKQSLSSLFQFNTSNDSTTARHNAQASHRQHFPYLKIVSAAQQAKWRNRITQPIYKSKTLMLTHQLSPLNCRCAVLTLSEWLNSSYKLVYDQIPANW